MNATELLDAYYQCWANKDLNTIEKILSPEFDFEGPMMKHDNPKAFIEALRAMGQNSPMRQGKVHAKFGAGDDACAIYDCESIDGKWKVTMAEHIRAKNGKIAQIRLFFDPAKMPRQ